ncbi:MAG: TldD/PmbA family protein [Hyphomonadaceae bacterium]|nr:TldD/PmbA family protein [Clostridia bacterium]
MSLEMFIKSLFQQGMDAGLTACEAYYVQGESFRVSIYEGEIDQYSVNNTRGISFRGLIDGKMGYAYSEVLDEPALSMLIKSVISNAKLIESEDSEFIYDGHGTYKEVIGFNEGLQKIEVADKIQLAKDLEKITLAQNDKVKGVEYCVVQSGESIMRIVNTKGMDKQFKSNAMIAIIVPIIEDNGRMYTGEAFQATQSFEEFDISALAKEAVEDGMRYIGADSVPSGQYNILLKNTVSADLLDTFTGIFKAENVQKGLSRLKGQLNQPIASELVSIIDDALLEGGLASAPFDAEGAPTATKTVVKNGVLQTYLYNLKTAAIDGVSTTGNAAKATFASPVDIAPYHFYVEKGNQTFEQLMTQMGDGLYITELAGLHAGANAVTGDFSLAAKGMRVENGKCTTPVEQITLGGNFYTLLKQINGIADDLHFGMPSSGGCFGSPAICIPNMSIGGKNE